MHSFIGSDTMLTPVVVIAVLILSAFYYLKWCYKYWERKRVFAPTPSIPFGNLNDVLLGKTSIGMKVKDFYKEIKLRELPYGGFYVMGKPVFLPVDLDLIRNILVKDFQHFTDRTGYVNEKRDPLSGHLFAQKGDMWKALRQTLAPTLSPGKLKMIMETIVACTSSIPTYLNERFSKNETVDIKDLCTRYTTDVTISTILGIECNSVNEPDNQFSKMGKLITDFTVSSFTLFMSLAMPKLFAFLGFHIAPKELEDFLFSIVGETANYRDKNKVVRRDLMQLLLELRDDGLKLEAKTEEDDDLRSQAYYKKSLTLNEIAAQVLVFFAGGFETSSSAMTFFMYELAAHPEMQETVRREISDALGNNNGKITYEIFGEMPFLDKCFQETLRKYPPLPVVPRECTKTYKIPGTDVVIDKGTHLMYSIYGIHHDPDYYPEPEKFDPERFSQKNKGQRPPLSYIPFGEGPRICIGLRLGILQAKAGLIAILNDFRFSINPRTKIPITYDPHHFTLHANGGIWLDVERIE